MPEPTDHALIRPPSLRAFLDAGGDPTTELGDDVDMLAETTFYDVRVLPPRIRAERAAQHRQHAEILLQRWDRPQLPPTGPLAKRRPLQELETALTWEADIFDDPHLAERLIPLLPPGLVAKHEADWDKWRRPHPLEVSTPDEWWSCQNCGTTYDVGEAEAVLIGQREGHSAWMQYEVHYCAGCIALVAEIIGVGA